MNKDIDKELWESLRLRSRTLETEMDALQRNRVIILSITSAYIPG